MQITARVQTDRESHQANVATDSLEKAVPIPPRNGQPGSSINGGELLFLALATCYGNDLFREAATRGIDVLHIDVTVAGEFGGAGEPARRITYRVQVEALASEEDILNLILHTDTVAEIHNTLRQGMPVVLESYDAIPVVE